LANVEIELISLKKVSVREWMRALENASFKSRKNKGSHHLYKHPDGRRVLLVYHRQGETFGPKTIKKILACTGWKTADLKYFNLLYFE